MRATARSRPGVAVRVLAALAGVAAVAGVAAIWSGLTVLLRTPCAWMTVLAALDAALLLRLAGFPRGRERAAIGLAITALTVLVAGYLFATAQIGLALGLRPAEAWWRMSPGLAWLYVQANAGWIESAWIAAGLALGWKSSR